MRTVALIANGLIESTDILRPAIVKHSRIVAVDAGLAYCKKMGIQPDLIVGDFDSCPEPLLNEYSKIPKSSLFRDKDVTDLEFAIEEELKHGAEKITLFGAWGKRIDHSLTNLLLLTRHPGKVSLETETETVFVIDKMAKINCFIGQTLSLIPINGAVTGITTKNLKWELKEAKMDQNFIGISNICLKEKVEISVKQGYLICCLNNSNEDSL